MASRTTGRRHGTLIVCAVLVGIAVVAVAFQGVPQFTGPRMLLPPAPVRSGPLPSQATTAGPGAEQGHHEVRIDLSWLLVALVVLAVVAGLALLWRLRRRAAAPPALLPLADLAEADAAGAPPEPEREPEPEQVRRGLDRAAEVLAEPREPRDAIERAWVGLEEGAADSGVRRLPAETPAEFAARVVARVAADRDAADRLLRIYLRARFGSAPITADDIAQAREAVGALQASWSSGSRTAHGGAR